MNSNKIKTLSLFTGAGGLDIGFHQAGFDIVACVELEQKYCDTLERNRELKNYISPKADIHNVDIRNFNAKAYSHLDIECVIGGPPCQTFSAAGRRSGGVIGLDDERGKLYNSYCNILDELNPEVFIFENVYGLPGANGGGPWRAILQAFSDHGYELRAEVIDAADYGVPQHRERLFMVGTRTGIFRFPKPKVGPDSGNGEPLVSVKDAIEDLQDSREKACNGLGGLYGHLLPEIPEGLNYAFFTAEMGHPEPVFAWRSKFHDLLYKVHRNQPCRTIKANPGKFTGPFHWKNRHFTIDELKRLQSFPDDYELVGSYSQVLEQIGNSVPPKLARVLAESIKEQILRPKTLKHELRENGFKSTFRQRQRARSADFKRTAEAAIHRKYGKLSDYSQAETTKPISKKYKSYYPSLFVREEATDKSPDTKAFNCSLIEAGKHIRIDVNEIDKQSPRYFAEVNITGLEKYLPKFDTLKLSAELTSIDSIFQAWREISEALVNRSKFFTLIDIYGHYANRGDVVDISTKFEPISEKDNCNALLLINHYGKTEKCGQMVTLSTVLEELSLSAKQFSKAVEDMRKMRFDLRTFDTHPIIGRSNIICTYPFPLLSPKAMVESKARLSFEQEIVARNIATA